MGKKKSSGQSKRARPQAKRKQHPRKSASPKHRDDLPLPPLFASEQVLGQMFGATDDNVYEAQQLAYEAMNAAHTGNPQRAVKLASQAVKLDPACVDALLLLAQAESETPDALIENVQRVVERGAQALGKAFFRENRGYFWGLLETRPYMRARASLADLLVEAGRIDDAITEYEEMLDLNPGDNQGLRYELLGLYLQTDRLSDAARLFKQFENEGSAMFAWGRVLERYLKGDSEAAEAALIAARKRNPHVEPLLTGRKRMPGDKPAYYGFGDENEAVVCVDAIGKAWKQHPEALAWLKQQAGAKKRS